MSWFWLNFPLCAAFFLAVAGIPLWMVIRHPDTGPASRPADTARADIAEVLAAACPALAADRVAQARRVTTETTAEARELVGAGAG